MNTLTEPNKSTSPSMEFKGHPKGLFYLFFTEMWERFSFYGLRALVVLYMTSELMFSDKKAFGVYAAYCTFVYLSTLAGGILADKYLGNRKAILSGGILITLGHFCLVFSAVGTNYFYTGLAFIIAGTGMFKANISSLVGQLYEPDSPRRDSGFTIFYMGINLGGLLAPLVCGIIGETYGWHYGFGLAGIGMLLGLVTFAKSSIYLDGKGEPPHEGILKNKIFAGINLEWLIYGCSFACVFLFSMCLHEYTWFEKALPVLGLFFGAYSIRMIFQHKGSERLALCAIFTLMFFQMAFFSIFEQAGSSVNLFTERNIDRTLLGYTIPTSVFQSLNPFFILFLGPLFAALWQSLSNLKKDPNPAIKFFIALVLVAFGFGALVLGIQAADSNSMTSMGWIILAYFLQTSGELCIMPVGLSMVTRLSPVKVLSTVMGMWFVSLAYSEYLAGLFSKLASVNTAVGEKVDTKAALETYESAFTVGMSFAFIMAFLLLLLLPVLKRAFQAAEKP